MQTTQVEAVGGDRSMIAGLPDFLSWQAGLDPLVSATRSHVRWSYRRLADEGRSSNVDLLGRVRRLPAENQRRLLLSPIVHYCLGYKGDRNAVAELINFVRVEERVAGCGTPASGWAAAADCYFGGPDEAPVTAAKKVGGMVIDTHCSHYDTSLPMGIGAGVPHSQDELDFLQQRITDAVDCASSINPVAGATIRTCTQLVRVRRGDARPEMTSSFSSRLMIGRVGLMNAHCPDRWTVADFTDALLHESIHSYVYKIELTSPLYVDPVSAQEKKGVSPWSGRELQIHSYVHACFVWYGLYSFWSSDGSTESRALAEAARKGFLTGGGPVDLLSDESRDAIQPDVQDAIREMTRRVR